MFLFRSHILSILLYSGFFSTPANILSMKQNITVENVIMFMRLNEILENEDRNLLKAKLEKDPNDESHIIKCFHDSFNSYLEKIYIDPVNLFKRDQAQFEEQIKTIMLFNYQFHEQLSENIIGNLLYKKNTSPLKRKNTESHLKKRRLPHASTTSSSSSHKQGKKNATSSSSQKDNEFD